MPDSRAVAAHFLQCLARGQRGETPFRHWLLYDMLPAATCAAIDTLPYHPPAIDDTAGRRETHNSTRLFFGREAQAAHPVCAAVAEALQSREVTRTLARMCDVPLAGSSLRIEYCLDTDGFWLEPHTDIGAKRFTMLVYLSDLPGCAAWGTDLLDAERRFVCSVPYRRNAGFMFIPSHESWHGFHRRPIVGVRRSLIVNYVNEDWRSRHELAFADHPVAA